MTKSFIAEGLRLAALETRDGPADALTIALSGRLDAYSIGAVWQPALAALRVAAGRRVIIDAGQVEYCDGAGIALIYDLCRQRAAGDAPVVVHGLAPSYQALLDQFAGSAIAPERRPQGRELSPIAALGRASAELAADLREQIEFVGETTAALAAALRNPRHIRWRDALLIAERSGVDALPIVALVSFLLGVILAFESAIPMRQFGAEIFVADLLGLSVLRELGPLMAAILLAGRCGAAFAAEIGTMKVSEELNALTTMGLDPVRFLVVTRLLAIFLMMPLLAIFADLIALFGGGLTMLSFGIPLSTFVKEMASIVKPTDVVIGIVKAFVFGALIAGIGCLRGLQTKTGAIAVGVSTTRAVVSGIVLIVVADGLFAILLYHLKL